MKLHKKILYDKYHTSRSKHHAKLDAELERLQLEIDTLKHKRGKAHHARLKSIHKKAHHLHRQAVKHEHPQASKFKQFAVGVGKRLTSAYNQLKESIKKSALERKIAREKAQKAEDEKSLEVQNMKQEGITPYY